MSNLFGGGGSSTTEKPEIPPELRPLIQQTTDAWMQFQDRALGRFMPGYSRRTYNPETGRYEDQAGTGGGNFGRTFEKMVNQYDETSDGGGGGGGGGGTGGGGGGGATGGGNVPGQLIGDPSQQPVDDTPGATVPFNPSGTAPIPWWYGSRGDALTPAWSWTAPSDIFGDAARPVLGAAPLEQWAAGLVPQLAEEGEDFGSARDLLDEMLGVSRRKVGGENLMEDPSYLAAISAFKEARQPLIENQAALSGLGRSTALTNATAAANAEFMLPVIQDLFAREERGIDRELGALSDAFGGRMALGDRGEGRLQNAIATGMSVGGTGREIGQDQADAAYNEFIRQATLFEQAMGGPMGLLPSTIGGTATTREWK